MLTPVSHCIIVRPEAVPETTRGGIYLTRDTREREQLSVVRGELVAIGPTAFPDYDDDNPSRPNVGDWIYMAKYGGMVVDHCGEQLRILNDTDVLAVIPKSDMEAILEKEGERCQTQP